MASRYTPPSADLFTSKLPVKPTDSANTVKLATPEELVELLTKPDPLAVPYEVASGTVSLFVGDFNSYKTDLLIQDWVPNQRHIVPASQYDTTSQVVYNLPVGSVMTLQDALINSNGNIADLSNCGTCVDLVGTGKTEAFSLIPLGFNDSVSMFFWRKVDLNMGAIELFDAINFTGRRSTIFLSEWQPGVCHNIKEWQLQDSTSSVRWKTLQDRQTAILYDGDDTPQYAGYAQFANIKGWGSTKECANLPEFFMNDCITSFKWNSINPVKEIIEPLKITTGSASNTSGLTSNNTGINDSDASQNVTVAITNSTSQTVTVQTSDQHVTGVSSTFSQTFSEGAEGIAESETQWSMSVSYSYTHTETNTRSETKTIDLSIEQVVTAPPRTSYVATLLVIIGQLPAAEYRTTAQRWYVDPVSGGKADQDNNGWYKRVEDVTLTLTGSLASSASTSIKTTDLPGYVRGVKQ
ncbi:hypothetical protein EAF00_005693 [Botryotinia globosa]|nr:hypothetical protein EAF00_005693 [Botryotinia globosa]